MKKIKLNKLEVRNSALTREQLKGIMGGSSSSSSYGDSGNPCAGKSLNDDCQYMDSSTQTIKYGKCKTIPAFFGWVCWAE